LTKPVLRARSNAIPVIHPNSSSLEPQLGPDRPDELNGWGAQPIPRGGAAQRSRRNDRGAGQKHRRRDPA
jgi:hypothetical protein